MIKKRLCFTLYYKNGQFCVSRNFNLQALGDVKWLMENYEFESIARSVDELLIINVGESRIEEELFIKTLHKIIENSFMPIAIGGGIVNVDQAKILFQNGADKLIINRILYDKQEKVREIIKNYGSQSIIASIDYKKREEVNYIYHKDKDRNIKLEKGIKIAEDLGVGELLINSVDRDGLGLGYDIETLENIHRSTRLPIIASGGGDSSPKLIEGLKSEKIDAVNASHLYNFMCDGLQIAREELMDNGINLSKWEFK